MGSKDPLGAGRWREKWGPYEAKHMMNALACRDRDGKKLAENDYLDQAYGQALKRFQRGDYPTKPAEQEPLPETGKLDRPTRKDLFLAYAKLVTRKPVAKNRIAEVAGAPFMGCGLFNPLSVTFKDAESRRAIVFVFDVAAEPQDLPCRLGDMGPCRSNTGPAPTKPDPEGKSPYRCKIYQRVAKSCPCNGGADLSHDLVVRLPFALDIVGNWRHELVVESDDGTIRARKKIATDARAVGESESEIYFPDLPPSHAYRMRAEGVDEPYQVFTFTPFHELSGLSEIPAEDALPPNAPDEDGDGKPDEEVPA